MLRTCLLKTYDGNPFTFEYKFNIARLPEVNPFVVNRSSNRSEQMRMIKFRFLHGDIFCKARMFKFGMTHDDKCEFCGTCETIKHQVWECQRAQILWNFINGAIIDCNMGSTCINYQM